MKLWNCGILPLWLSLAEAQGLRVVCFGDSTTAPREGVVPYCEQLRSEQRVMINRGVAGNTTEDARKRFETAVLAERADVVVMQFGINDSTVDVWKQPAAREARVPLERFRENLEYMVGQVRESGGEVVLMSFGPLRWTEKLRGLYGRLPYRAEDPEGLEAGRAAYREAVREVARKYGLKLVDVEALYRREGVESLLLDGLHPNTRGHEVVARELRKVLEPRRR